MYPDVVRQFRKNIIAIPESSPIYMDTYEAKVLEHDARACPLIHFTTIENSLMALESKSKTFFIDPYYFE